MIEVVDMLCLFAFHLCSGQAMGRSSIRGESGHPCSVSNQE